MDLFYATYSMTNSHSVLLPSAVIMTLQEIGRVFKAGNENQEFNRQPGNNFCVSKISRAYFKRVKDPIYLFFLA